MGLGGCIILIAVGAVGTTGVFVCASIARRSRLVVPPSTTVVSDDERPGL